MERWERQLCQMAALQDRLNMRVHADWRSRGNAWYRAVWVECAELLDHYGWKWWKRQTADLEHVRLEIVDIWHFGLSELLRDGRIGADHLANDVRDAFARSRSSSDFRTAVESLARETLLHQAFPLAEFLEMMASLPMTFDELFRRYVGKNVLNEFRQAHGYNDGTYRKTWQGREDNEHLMELTEKLDHTRAAFADELYHALEARYSATA
jgi:hypothetical protein